MAVKHIAARCLAVLLALSLLLSLAACRVVPAAANAATPPPTPVPTPAPTHDPVAKFSEAALQRAMDSVPFSLIDGRLLIRMPVGAKDEALQRGIMSASPSNHAETRLMLEGGGQELVVYTQESFYCSDNLEGDLDRILKARYGNSFAYMADAVYRTGGIKVARFSPVKLDTSTDAVLVRGAVVQLADTSFLTVSVYATPVTLADQELCLKQINAILDTLQSGTRTIDTAAHEEQLGENNIVISLDNGYELIQDEGVDFSVFYLMKFVKLGESAPSIGIYVGDHPSPMYAQRGIEDSQITTVKDNILNHRADWWTYKPSADSDAFSAETLFNLTMTLQMHIFVDADSEAEFQQVKKMIDTMKIKK